MTTAPSTGRRMSNTDWYEFEGLEPTLYRRLDDDFSLVLGHARLLGYNYYLFPGLVMQLQPESYLVGIDRFFVSFNIMNDARQCFHEASGAGMVFNHRERDEFIKALEGQTLEQRRRLQNGSPQPR